MIIFFFYLYSNIVLFNTHTLTCMQLQCNKMKITRVGCVTDVTDQYPLGDREFRRSFVIMHEQDMSWGAVAETVLS